MWFPPKKLKILIGCYVTDLGSYLQIAHVQIIHMHVKVLTRLLAAWITDSGKQRQYPRSGSQQTQQITGREFWISFHLDWQISSHARPLYTRATSIIPSRHLSLPTFVNFCTSNQNHVIDYRIKESLNFSSLTTRSLFPAPILFRAL